MKQDYSNEAVREALNKKPELFQKFGYGIYKRKIEELFDNKKKNKENMILIVMKEKEEVEKAKKRYNF